MTYCYETLNDPGPGGLPTEWTPLDDLIQTWAGFAHMTISQAGLEAASSAFTALALETRARQGYADALHVRKSLCWTPRWQMLLHHTLCDLSDACAQWIAAAELLSRVQTTQDEEAVRSVPDVGRAVACHVQHLFSLFLRLVQEHETARFSPHSEEVTP